MKGKLKKGVPLHADVRRVVKGKLLSREEILTGIKKIRPSCTEDNLDTTLNRMVNWGEIVRVSKGVYQDINYDDVYAKIKDVLKFIIDDQGYTNDEFMNISEVILKQVAEIAVVDTKDPEIRRKFFEIAREIYAKK
jgi:hypothetical protein